MGCQGWISLLQSVTGTNVELSKLNQPETQHIPTCKSTGNHIRSMTTPSIYILEHMCPILLSPMQIINQLKQDESLATGTADRTTSVSVLHHKINISQYSCSCQYKIKRMF